MTTIDQLNVDMDDIHIEPKTKIIFTMRNGTQINVATPLDISDFSNQWNNRKKTIKIMGSYTKSYVFIRKKSVDVYYATPIL